MIDTSHRLASSPSALEGLSLDTWKYVFNCIPDDIAFETIGKTDKRFHEITAKLIQRSTFLLASRRQDQVLAVYLRDGVTKTIKLTNGMVRERFSIRLRRIWSSSKFQRTFLANTRWGDMKWISVIDKNGFLFIDTVSPESVSSFDDNILKEVMGSQNSTMPEDIP